MPEDPLKEQNETVNGCRNTACLVPPRPVHMELGSWNSPRFRETIGNEEQGGERKGEHGRECTASSGNVRAYPSHALSVNISLPGKN